MECVNQELDQFLRLFVNERQNDWYDLLPIVEFQHNNHVHSAMQQPPFLLDTGRIPCMGFEPNQAPSGLETVNEFTEQMKSATEEAKSAIHKAQEDMTRYYNRRRSPAPVFKPGDRVYLDASDIRTTRPSPKLSHHRLGPFEIECQVGPLAYRLKLPHGLRQLHPVFNVVSCPPLRTIRYQEGSHKPRRHLLSSTENRNRRWKRCWIVAGTGEGSNS